MKIYTDHPIKELGDEEFKPAPLRECYILSYDNNKYCWIKIGDLEMEIKRCYLYRDTTKMNPVSIDDINILSSAANEYIESFEAKWLDKIVNSDHVTQYQMFDFGYLFWLKDGRIIEVSPAKNKLIIRRTGQSIEPALSWLISELDLSLD